MLSQRTAQRISRVQSHLERLASLGGTRESRHDLARVPPHPLCPPFNALPPGLARFTAPHACRPPPLHRTRSHSQRFPAQPSTRRPSTSASAHAPPWPTSSRSSCPRAQRSRSPRGCTCECPPILQTPPPAGQHANARPCRASSDNEWSAASDGATFETVDPSTGKKQLDFAHATKEDVDRAVVAARKAFKTTWGKKVAATERATRESQRGCLMTPSADPLPARRPASPQQVCRPHGARRADPRRARVVELGQGHPHRARRRRRRHDRVPALLCRAVRQDSRADD